MNLHQGVFKYRLPLDCEKIVRILVERTPGNFIELTEVQPKVMEEMKKLERQEGAPIYYANFGEMFWMHPTPNITGEYGLHYLPLREKTKAPSK